MSCAEEVRSIKRAMEKDEEGTRALELLGALRDLPVSLKVLTDTGCGEIFANIFLIIITVLRIGRVVNNLRKSCKEDEVSISIQHSTESACSLRIFRISYANHH